jgi:hypothetical protein
MALVLCRATVIDAVTVYNQIPLALATTGTVVSATFMCLGLSANETCLTREQLLSQTLRHMIFVFRYHLQPLRQRR